ncbi:hypothetical protein [Haloarchaeobius baliensis]|uniref:hypothetical protein n=1 Tax=Haloarchaeobius baliensis TaxID=1670458 RepID=UPI003F8849B5
MVRILVRHTVESYDAWKPHFDEHERTRQEYGSQGYQLFRTSDDSNDIVALMDWDSTENARRFLEDSDVREVMSEAGVVGEPEIAFLDEVESKTSETPMA